MNIDQLRDLHAKCVAVAEKGENLPPNMTIVVDKKYMIENETFWLVSFDGTNTFGKVDRNFDTYHKDGIIQFAKAVGLYEEPQPEPQQPQGLYPVGTRAKVCDKVMVIENTSGHGYEIGKIVTSVDGASMFNKGYEQWYLSPNEYVIIEESDPFLKSVRNYLKNTPPDEVMAAWKATEPKAIDPALLQLTCAALTGVCANPESMRHATYDEWVEQAISIAKATHDELMKETEK